MMLPSLRHPGKSQCDKSNVVLLPPVNPQCFPSLISKGIAESFVNISKLVNRKSVSTVWVIIPKNQ